MISVVIIEDQTLVREGFMRLLEFASHIQCVGSATDGESGLELMTQVEPDIALVDIQMPKMDGFTFIAKQKKLNPITKFIVLTTFDDQQYLETAHRLEVGGFLLKDVSFDELVSAIETVYKGGSLLPPLTRSKIITPNCAESLPFQPLTPREKEIFALLSQGFANKEIANQLSLSNGTIKNHVSNILSKLGVRDRTQAVLKFKSVYGVG